MVNSKSVQKHNIVDRMLCFFIRGMIERLHWPRTNEIRIFLAALVIEINMLFLITGYYVLYTPGLLSKDEGGKCVLYM